VPFTAVHLPLAVVWALLAAVCAVAAAVTPALPRSYAVLTALAVAASAVLVDVTVLFSLTIAYMDTYGFFEDMLTSEKRLDFSTG